jgi:hypothetical protein
MSLASENRHEDAASRRIRRTGRRSLTARRMPHPRAPGPAVTEGCADNFSLDINSVTAA